MSEPLYVVEVTEEREERLAGQSGCTYVSPPQPSEQALALVRVLVGAERELRDVGGDEWRVPVAGGRRLIRMRRVATEDRG